MAATIKPQKRCRQFFVKTVFDFSSSVAKGLNLHIFTSNKRKRYAKFWLEPAVLLEESRGFHSSDLLRIHNLIEENREVFRLKWDEHFSQ